MPEIMDTLTRIPLKNLKRRLLILLYAHKDEWTSTPTIFKIVLLAFKRGDIDAPYSFQWVRKTLSELNSLGLVNKRPMKSHWGRRSEYVINGIGISQLEKNDIILQKPPTNTNNNNNNNTSKIEALKVKPQL